MERVTGVLLVPTAHSTIRPADSDLDTASDRRSPISPEQNLFWSVLEDSAREALKNALGDLILGVLTAQKMLENLANALEFTERLRIVFGTSGAKTIQFVIVKELYRRLNLPFDPEGLFDYATFLQAAKNSFSKRRRRDE